MVTLTNSPTYGPLPTFAPPARGLRLAGIAAAHALVAWALLHSDVVGIALRQATPLTVALISQAPTAPKAEPSLPQALPRSAPPRVPALPPPEITVAPAAPTNMPAVAPAMMAPATVVRAEPADVNPVAAAPTQRAPTTPVVPTPASPKPLTAGAIHYRVPPPVVVPMASRRLGESLLAKSASGRKAPTVVIYADAGASHQSVVNVLEAARLAGLGKVSFATQTGAGRKP